MGAELQIKGDTLQVAQELALLRGLDVATVVDAVLRQTLVAERERVGRVERMLALGREIRAHMREPDAPDELYDADGLFS